MSDRILDLRPAQLIKLNGKELMESALQIEEYLTKKNKELGLEYLIGI